MERLLTGDGVLVAVALADANQEGAIFVLGGQQQLLSLQPVDVAVVPPAAGQAHRLLEQQHITTTHGCRPPGADAERLNSPHKFELQISQRTFYKTFS